jgi:hypothetical protein
MGQNRREIKTVRGQSYVLRLPKYCPLLRGGHTRRVERGMGGQYFGRREKKDFPLTMISLRP